MSPFSIARPYNRWGTDVRCELWTLCGALAALVCGVAAALVGLSRGDVHGPIAVVGFIAIVLFVARRVFQITDRRRAA